ncbi:MAG: hypothetical protein M0Q45_11210 [Bacteroidales bacterium]|nr:hypothetical protein [Bacteroidales bacterium]MCK9500057.1 hypothetical protein [Bacteroidales bacterium]
MKVESASRFSLRSMLEDGQALIYTDMASRFSLRSKLEDDNHELHEFTLILTSSHFATLKTRR